MCWTHQNQLHNDLDYLFRFIVLICPLALSTDAPVKRTHAHQPSLMHLAFTVSIDSMPTDVTSGVPGLIASNKFTLPTLWRAANCIVTLASTTLSMTVAKCRMWHSMFPPQRLQLTGYSSGARPSHLAANFPSPCRCSVTQSPQESGLPSSASPQVCLDASSLDSPDKEEIIQIFSRTKFPRSEIRIRVRTRTTECSHLLTHISSSTCRFWWSMVWLYWCIETHTKFQLKWQNPIIILSMNTISN